MSNLNFVKLNSVCDRITDGSHYSPVGITDGLPMLSVKDMEHNGFSYLDCKYISEEEYEKMLRNDCVPLLNDVLIAKDGSYLKHVFVIKEEKKQAILSSIGILRPNLKKISPDYLKYYLHSNSVKETVAKKYVSGSALPRIILKNFGEIDIIYKPLLEQQKIAKVLSDLDAKIELNNKINAELEAMAKTLYDYWFVQFDFPNEKGKPYKSSGGKMVWNEELKREIPEGWEVGTLLDIATFTNGLACQKFRPQENEDYFRVIKIREMGSGFTENSELVSTNIPEKVIVYDGDILFSWSATLDVKIWTGGTGGLNQHIFKVTSKKYPKSYYYFELLNYLQHFKMIAELRKTTMGHITQDHLKESRIIIPPMDLINKLDRIIKPILDKKVKLEEENQELASLRDWLLPMLMNGQVTVASTTSAAENGYEVEDSELSMVAEPAEELKSKNQKQAKVISLKPSNVDIYKRTLLAAEIVYQLHNEATLGHLKLQKLLYLCQEINNMSLPMNFLKQAMGPYDNRLMRSLDKQLEEKRWFKFEKNEFLKYKQLGAVGSHQNDYQKYFEADKPKIDYLIATFRKYKSHDIEAVATLYACWKEAIENKELINLELILKKFYSWSKEKEKFNPDDLKKHLNWMKNNGIYPR